MEPRVGQEVPKQAKCAYTGQRIQDGAKMGQNGAKMLMMINERKHLCFCADDENKRKHLLLSKGGKLHQGPFLKKTMNFMKFHEF